jgi:hypothetical protein
MYLMDVSILYVEKIYIHLLLFIGCEDKKDPTFTKIKRAHRRPE